MDKEIKKQIQNLAAGVQKGFEKIVDRRFDETQS